MALDATYRLFRQAILGRKQVTCLYNKAYRELCPHILGYKNREAKALCFQFGGESTSGLPAEGEWRCLTLAKVDDASIRDGDWHTGQRHATTQACIDIVDLDVNLLP